jgi:hypothetical protein
MHVFLGSILPGIGAACSVVVIVVMARSPVFRRGYLDDPED